MPVVLTPQAEYQRRLDAGLMRPNPTQDAAVDALTDLFQRLLDAPTNKKTGWFSRSSTDVAQKGVYLHGPVGRGKTTIMDLFYNVLPFKEKQRVHFHEFMLDVHKKIHALQSNGKGEPIAHIAKGIAKTTRVLCFDEFVVNNIADAMILGRLYQALTQQGVTIVATSNFEPDLLYKDGLQRERFVPFIDVLKANTQSLYVDHTEDYRRLSEAQGQTYFCPLNAAVADELERQFSTITADGVISEVVLNIGSRELHISRAVDGCVAWLDFASFLDQPLGPADFLAIAQAFPTVIISHIPLLTPTHRNQARRFITLVDALYNQHRCLICSAEAEPDQLYPDGDGAFEFQRTASRLMEMRSEAYLKAC